MSNQLFKVILYGNSLILQGVRASLEACSEIEVRSLPPDSVSLKREITTKSPATLVFDASVVGPDFPNSLLQQTGLLLIGIDPKMHQALVWTSRQAAVVDAADLLNIIHQEDSQSLGEAISPTQGREEH